MTPSTRPPALRPPTPGERPSVEHAARARRRRLGAPARALAANLMLSAAIGLGLLGALEGWARWTSEPALPAPPALRGAERADFRDRPRTRQPPAGWRRIAVLGDSVTYGYQLPAEQAFPQQLEALLSARGVRVEVLNAGVPGWSTREERLAYARLRPYRPERVLLAVCLNDLPALHHAAAAPPPWLTALHRRSALVRRLVDAPRREIRSVRQLFLEPDAAPVAAAFERFASEVRLLRDEVRADGASLALVVFPYRFQVLPGAPAPTVQERLSAIASGLGVPLLDLLPTLRERGAGDFVDVCHLTASGARRVAEALSTSALLELAPRPALTPPATRR